MPRIRSIASEFWKGMVLGLTPAMLYNQLGGGGYVQWTAGIRGYLSESELNSCILGTTICDQIDAKQEIASYFNRQLASKASNDPPLFLKPHWDSVSIGVAHLDYAFVIYVLFERKGVEFVDLPTVADGYLTIEARLLSNAKVSRLDFYSLTLPSPDSQPEDQDIATQQQPLFSIFNLPPPGVWFQLPNTGSRVADAWTFNGDTLSITANISESIQEEGVYRMVVWVDGDEVPLGQYHILVDNRAAFTRGETSPQFSKVESQPIEELRRFALELINADREDHGVPAVRLGSNESAQVHAEDALEHGYVGHWTTSGLKPYMIYQLEDWAGVVGENAAGTVSPEHRLRCLDPLIYCAAPNPQDEIRDFQWSMMYDDAHADWGHRDTIIDPDYDTVNIGIAYDESGLSFYQHFEYTELVYLEKPSIENGNLRFRARTVNDHRIIGVSIYYDHPLESKTPEEIGSLKSYCIGGGFTDQCDEVEPILRVLMPPELRWGEGYRYDSLTEEDIIADTWDSNDGALHVEANVRRAVSRPGVYTLAIWSGDDDPKLLGVYSIFVED